LGQLDQLLYALDKVAEIHHSRAFPTS